MLAPGHGRPGRRCGRLGRCHRLRGVSVDLRGDRPGPAAARSRLAGQEVRCLSPARAPASSSSPAASSRSLGKGIAAASIGRLLVSRGLSVGAAEVRPVHQRRPRHDVAVPARRGVRDRGRRGDRPRPRPLRALHRREHVARLQRHRRRDLQLGHPQGAPRRLPRRHGPGRPAHHRRDQAPRQADRREPGRRRRHHRDRRHGRRHRVAAVPRGDPPVPGRRRPPPLHVHPPHARALHRPRRRAEDQADAALGQRAAPHRHPARHGRLPLRGRAAAGHPQEDRAVRLAAASRRSSPPATSTTSTRSRCSSAPRASTTSCSSTSASRREPPTLGRLGAASCAAPARPRRASRCGSRSSASTSSSRTPTCRSSRRCATRASSTAARSRSTGSTPRRSTTTRCARRLAEADGILIPGGFGVRGIEGKIARGRDRPRAAHPVPRHLPRHADRGGRVRAPRGRHGRRELDRVRPRDAVSR